MDRTTRQAALWATVVAVPLTLIVALLVLLTIRPGDSAPAAEPSPTAPRPQSTTPVAMPAPELSTRAATVCRALLSRLPASIRDLHQRPVTEGPEQNAAYGDPAITVSCGVTMPAIPPTDLVYPLSRVCWHSADRQGATEWTTVDREVPVRVTVPKQYDQPGQWTIAFSDPVIAAVPSLKQIPTGCGP
ncbi:hypothetical protein GCM10022251_45950 [Phytohabitans flavus]|uniref:DUF3515 domain-containing protein n=1 Tax=Phytohabitans flavus TaxID=1076124 RepID=A0A6F8Y7Q8_9ACTN|nr:DUF3515 domain-containing protein [Phytohabitans flavus]BCB82152.1 hypothetical protein Pflav_085620 [Phytohabitans flavus]